MNPLIRIKAWHPIIWIKGWRLIKWIKECWRLKYFIDLVIMGKGVNHHQTINDFLNQKNLEFNKVKYNIDINSVFMKQRGFFTRLKERLLRKKNLYSLYYIQGKKDPIKIHKQTTPLLTSNILDIAKRSTALSKALSELFRGHVSGKLILFLVIAVIVIILVYVVMTGGITIPEGLLPF